MTTIYVTHSTLTDDDATGHGLTENIYDVPASNDAFNDELRTALEAIYPGVTIDVQSGNYDDTRVTVHGDDLDEDDVRETARDIVGTLYGQGDFWVEAIPA